MTKPLLNAAIFMRNSKAVNGCTGADTLVLPSADIIPLLDQERRARGIRFTSNNLNEF